MKAQVTPGKRPDSTTFYVREAGALHRVHRIMFPSKGDVVSTVLVRFADTDEVRRVNARDLIRS
jgi:hypothetical protein